MSRWESFARDVEFTLTRFSYSSGYSRIFFLFSIFLHFSSSTYWNRRRFFPRGCRQPLSKSLDSDWRPFAFRSDHVGEKRRAEVPLVFHVEAAARASSPIRGTFSANRSENFAVSDVCNWQIILMVILDEMCHRQPHKFYSAVDPRYTMLPSWYKPSTLRSISSLWLFNLRDI